MRQRADPPHSSSRPPCLPHDLVPFIDFRTGRPIICYASVHICLFFLGRVVLSPTKVVLSAVVKAPAKLLFALCATVDW